MSIIKRVDNLLNEKGLKAISLCKFLGIPSSTYYTWRQKGIDPKAEYLPMIADFLGVSLNYLVSGEEEKGYYYDPEVAEMAQEIYENPELRILFDASRKVSKEDLQLVVDMMKRLKKDDDYLD